MRLRAAWGDPQGQPRLVTAQGSAAVATQAEARALGQRVAADLQAGGARP